MVKKTLVFILLFVSAVFSQGTKTYSVCTSGCDYATFTLAEDARDQDLVANDSLLTFSGEDTGTLVENLTVAGWTMDATRYLLITVASGHRHDGTRGTGLIIDPSANGHCVEIDESFTRLEYLELTGVQSSSDEGVRIDAGADNVFLKWLLIYDLDGASTDGIYTGNWAVTNLNIEGCIVINCDRAGIHMQNHSGSSTQTVNIKHTTVISCNVGGSSDTDRGGIVNSAATSTTNTITCDNVIVMNINEAADYQSDGNGGTETWAGSFNMSEDGSANLDGMTNGLLNQTYADQFVSVTADAENIHLKVTTNDAEDAGHTVTLQTAEDFEGHSIPQNSVHDMGADEVLAAAARRVIITGF